MTHTMEERYRITVQTYDKVAAAYQDKFMDMDLYNDTYDRFCQLIGKPDAQVLELGCGPGNITRYLLAQQPGWQIEGIDAAPNMVALARQNNPAAVFTVMDCRDIGRLAPDAYDGIIAGFCLPYLSREDAAKLVRDCMRLLKLGGCGYFSFVAGNYEDSGYETGSTGDQVYFYYHEEDFLQEVVRENQLVLTDLIHKQYPLAEGEFSTHTIFIAQKR